MTTDAKVQIGNSADFLEGTSVDTAAGANLFREGVVISDPDSADARANIKALGVQLTTSDKGLVVNAIIHGETTGGGGGYRDVKVNPSGALAADVSGSTVALDAPTLAALENINATVSGSVSVSNFPATQAVSGTVALDSGTLAALETINVGNFPATQAVSGTVELGSTTLTALESINVQNTVTVDPLKATTGGVTSVTATTTPFTLLAANSSRKGATVFNTSATSMLYISLGPTVSTTLFTVRIEPSGYYEVPFNYVGLLSGVFSAALGGANVTEIT